MVGIGCGAAGEERAQRAVDQRREVSPEVTNPRETLDAAVRRLVGAETQSNVIL